MAYTVHATQKGVIRKASVSSAKRAAETAVVRASVGYRVTVFDGNRVMMTCAPGKKYRGGKRAARGFSTASCKIVDPAFKRSLKAR